MADSRPTDSNQCNEAALGAQHLGACHRPDAAVRVRKVDCPEAVGRRLGATARALDQLQSLEALPAKTGSDPKTRLFFGRLGT